MIFKQKAHITKEHHNNFTPQAKANKNMSMQLEAIARGETPAQKTRTEIIDKISSKASASEIYSCLIRFVWLVLTERRMDPELRQWHRNLLDIAHILKQRGQNGDNDCATKLECLADQIRISVSLTDTTNTPLPQSDTNVLNFLQKMNGYTPRAKIEETLKFKPGALSRILTTLTIRGLVQRETTTTDIRYRATSN